MSMQHVRLVPYKQIRVKQEILTDDEEANVACRLCSKMLVSEVALRNHVRMEHFEAFASGDPSTWMNPVVSKTTTPVQPVRGFSVVPFKQIKVKQEPLSDDEEASVSCRLCSKVFVSEVALRNHVRMEHFEAFASGDSSTWMNPVVSDNETRKGKQNKLSEDKELIKQRTEKILSAMTPGNLMTLASNDVSYIIIKSEDSPVEPGKKKRVRLMKVNKNGKESSRRKEPEPITGPFECVHPSGSVSGGVCHQIFFSCCEYSAHHRDEHTRRRKGLRCQVCEKPLAGGDADAPPYSCEVCGAGFNASRELSEHTSVAHVKLKPFQCTICHKRFTQQGGVQQHMRMHTGDRPFPCTFCPKAFTQKSGLDQHLRIHTKVKPYRCVICSKSFCQSVHLKQHMRTHTNVSPFQCGICQKRFKQSSHLNYHLRNHNPGTMTEEQKEKYAELIGMITRNNTEVEMSQEQVELEQVELEQVAAESSIQIVEADDQYIYMDKGTETWSVQVVDS